MSDNSETNPIKNVKITNSRDGHKRFNITVSFRLGRNNLISILCYELNGSLDDLSEGPSQVPQTYKTRTGQLRLVKEHLMDYGEDRANYWTDNTSNTRIQTVSEIVTSLVDLCWPELVVETAAAVGKDQGASE